LGFAQPVLEPSSRLFEVLCKTIEDGEDTHWCNKTWDPIVWWEKQFRSLAKQSERCLIFQGLDIALEETKRKQLKDADWNLIQKRVVSQIQIRLALVQEVNYNILGKLTPRDVWEKWESLCFEVVD